MKERILETADRLFYLQAFRAWASIPSPPKSASPKRTLYNHFPSKER